MELKLAERALGEGAGCIEGGTPRSQPWDGESLSNDIVELTGDADLRLRRTVATGVGIPAQEVCLDREATDLLRRAVCEAPLHLVGCSAGVACAGGPSAP